MSGWLAGWIVAAVLYVLAAWWSYFTDITPYAPRGPLEFPAWFGHEGRCGWPRSSARRKGPWSLLWPIYAVRSAIWLARSPERQDDEA